MIEPWDTKNEEIKGKDEERDSKRGKQRPLSVFEPDMICRSNHVLVFHFYLILMKKKKKNQTCNVSQTKGIHCNETKTNQNKGKQYERSIRKTNEKIKRPFPTLRVQETTEEDKKETVQNIPQ